MINSGKDFCVAMNLKNYNIQNNNTAIDRDKTKIVFMFDDGWRSVHSEAYSLMKEYGYKGSVSIIPSLIVEDEYMSYKELAELYLEGWDLLNHSYSHRADAYNNTDELLSDFDKSRRWMDNRYFGKCSDMVVMPHGEINPYLIRQLKNAGYRSVRTSDNIIVLDSFNYYYYPITSINPVTNISANEVTAQLKQGINELKTFVLIFHKIGYEDDEFGMTYNKDMLKQIIMFIDRHSDKFQVLTYSQLDFNK